LAQNALNLELVVTHPSGAPVVQAYLDGTSDVMGFFRGHFTDPEAYREKAAEVDRRFDRAARERAAEAMGVPTGADAHRLERFVEDGGYVVTTGQQPGLFGGPLYNVYKGLTVVRLAEALETLLGKPVLPLFWVGSEDHDWKEANHTCIVGVDNELFQPELASPHPDAPSALHRITLPAEVGPLRDAFLEHLPRTDFSRPWAELLENVFVEGATLPGGFHRVMEELLGPYGVCFTDAADLALKVASAPVMERELEDAAALERVLVDTASRLETAGYGLQVSLMEGGVNLFLEGPAGRERVYRDGSGYRLRVSEEHLSAAEVRARREEDPRVLSPNVFLRPVVESAVFPTVSYVAGPGEMAYFAQLADYFEAHGIRMPVIHPRFGATAVEGKVRKVMDKFGLDLDHLDRPFHEIAGEIAREDVPQEVRRAMGTLRGTIGKGVGELQNAVISVDPTLKGPVQHVRSQAFAALDDLEKKVVHAVKRENEIALAQLEKAQLHLYPTGKPQERVINPFYYLMRYGRAFLDEAHRRFEVNLDAASGVQ
jgi:bacillithiol biosynthesis cysteine-adding enzyme BshC